MAVGTPQDPPATVGMFLPAAQRLTQLFGRLDPAFATLWQNHLSRLLSRPGLDNRTRFELTIPASLAAQLRIS